MDARTQAQVEELAGLVREARYVMALTGAGISTESGIPDFRGPKGMWTKNPAAEKTATIQHYMANRDARVNAWRNRLGSAMWQAEPNAGHLALAELERRGKLETIVTQNVDGLHQKAGNSPERVIEIHGTIHEFTCMQCGEHGPIERVLRRVEAGEEDPPCRSCGGILKTATISFGQALVPDVLAWSEQAAEQCDVFFAIGTTLGVYPAAGLVPTALRNGATLAILNAQETPFDEYARFVIREQLGEVLPALVAAL